MFIFVLFTIQIRLNEKRVDDVLGTQTWGSRMESADKSKELWRNPQTLNREQF